MKVKEVITKVVNTKIEWTVDGDHRIGIWGGFEFLCIQNLIGTWRLYLVIGNGDDVYLADGRDFPRLDSAKKAAQKTLVMMITAMSKRS